MMVWQFPQNQKVKLIIHQVYFYSSKYNEAVKSHSYHDYIQTNDLRNWYILQRIQNITLLFKKIAWPY